MRHSVDKIITFTYNSMHNYVRAAKGYSILGALTIIPRPSALNQIPLSCIKPTRRPLVPLDCRASTGNSQTAASQKRSEVLRRHRIERCAKSSGAPIRATPLYSVSVMPSYAFEGMLRL